MARLRSQMGRARLVAVGLVGTLLSACMSWQPQALEPERFRRADSTQTLRLTLTNGDTIVVASPVIAGDSLVGMEALSGAPDSLRRRSVPLTAISQTEVQKSNPNPVGALVALAAAAFLLSQVDIMGPGWH